LDEFVPRLAKEVQEDVRKRFTSPPPGSPVFSLVREGTVWSAMLDENGESGVDEEGREAALDSARVTSWFSGNVVDLSASSSGDRWMFIYLKLCQWPKDKETVRSKLAEEGLAVDEVMAWGEAQYYKRYPLDVGANHPDQKEEVQMAILESVQTYRDSILVGSSSNSGAELSEQDPVSLQKWYGILEGHLEDLRAIGCDDSHPDVQCVMETLEDVQRRINGQD